MRRSRPCFAPLRASSSRCGGSGSARGGRAISRHARLRRCAWLVRMRSAGRSRRFRAAGIRPSTGQCACRRSSPAGRSMLVSGSATAETVLQELQRAERRRTPAGGHLADLQAALARFASAAYGRTGAASDSDLDEALERATHAVRRVARRYTWPARAARAARQSAVVCGIARGHADRDRRTGRGALHRVAAGHAGRSSLHPWRPGATRAHRLDRSGRRDARPAIDDPARAPPAARRPAGDPGVASAAVAGIRPARPGRAARGRAALVRAGAGRSLFRVAAAAGDVSRAPHLPDDRRLLEHGPAVLGADPPGGHADRRPPSSPR